MKWVHVNKPALNVWSIEPDVYEDFRGENYELCRKNLFYGKVGIKFVQDNISRSTKKVLRGIHGDFKTWKLISCLYGKIYLVVVNCYEGSSRFGEWAAFVLSDKNHRQILIPPGCGNAHLVLSNEAIFHYKMSQYFEPQGQFSYRYDDSRFNIWWPVKNPILSQRDEEGQYVETNLL